MEKDHRTGFGICWYSPSRASAAVRISRACQLLIRGIAKIVEFGGVEVGLHALPVRVA